MTEWKEVIGTQKERPSEIDTTSSSDYVYERKNITEYTETDDQEEITLKGWKYLERKIPKGQWTVDVTAQNKQNLDAIMAGMIDLYELQLEGLGE